MSGADVAPGLWDALEERFRALYESDRALRGALQRVEDGTATYADAAEFAERVSRDLALACSSVLTDDALPDGHMYWNIADRVLRPAIGEQTGLISDVCQRTQEALNKAAGIGMKAVRVEPERDRVHGILDEAANAERFSDVADQVYSHIDNLGRHMVDESVRQNADAQWKAGLSPKVHRTGSSSCCQWCADLAGTYDYGEVAQKGSDVWRRHANCGCLIEYDPGDGRRRAVDNYRWSGHYESEGRGVHRHAVYKADMSEEEIARRIEASKALTSDRDPARIEARKAEAERIVAEADDRTKSAEQRTIEIALKLEKTSSAICNAIRDNHMALANYSPESMKKTLESLGYDVLPLSRGNYKGVSFSEGGGYKIIFGGDGVFQYHPEKRSHHGGAYWKIKNGEEEHRYGMDGNEI